ncbi:MAG: aspartyl protease family protein [Candidatus Paceibacterota bacterium]|jgi:hypothetical protein
MKFPYKKIGPKKLKPIIPVEIMQEGNSISFHALIDSGADLNLFPGELAELLGLNILDGLEGTIGGITTGEMQKYYSHQVHLVIGGHSYKTRVAFMPTLSTRGHGLLGQVGFFDFFTVKFNYSKAEIEIKESVK